MSNSRSVTIPSGERCNWCDRPASYAVFDMWRTYFACEEHREFAEQSVTKDQRRKKKEVGA